MGPQGKQPDKKKRIRQGRVIAEINKFINFSPPLIAEDEIQEVVESLKSGWITTGPKAKEFEKRVCEYTGAKYAVATSSCTSALFLALKALGVNEGNEVIVPTFTFASTAHVVVHCGAIPLFIDCDFDTFQIDTSKIEEKITPRTKAIIPVHYGGNPVEMKEVLKLSKKYNLKVIEDSAHAIGSEYKGKKIGSLESNATCFSFYATKNLTTAEGGMIVTDDKELADIARKMTMYGISDSREIWDSRYAKTGNWFYDIEMIGYKANMADINAAMGIYQLEKLDRFIDTRKKYAHMYTQKLDGTGCEFMKIKKGNKSAWHLFPLLLPSHIDRDDFITGLNKRGVGSSVLFRPLHMHSVYKKLLGTKEGDFPISESIFNRLVNIPVSPAITRDEIVYSANQIRALLECV